MAGKKVVITIGRQYGSGGADTGRRLAEELGLGFYDKNILRMNSDESGIKESYFHLADEKAGNKLLYKIISSPGRNGGTAPRLFVCRHRSEGGKNQGKGSLR